MNFRPAFAALSMTLALAACGDLPFVNREPETPAHSGPPTVSPVDQPIETGEAGAAVSTAEATTMNTAIFRATGTEPFWAVTAGSDTAVYERPGQRSVGVGVRRITYARGVEFIGVMNGRPFTLNVQAGQCSDGMSDTKYPFTARLSTGGQRLTGCAGPTDAMPKAQVRASAGTPAPRRAAPAAPAAAPRPAPTATETPPASPAEPGDTTATTPTSPVVTPPAATTPSPSAVTTPGGTPDATPNDTTPNPPAATSSGTTPDSTAPSESSAPSDSDAAPATAPTAGTGNNGGGTGTTTTVLPPPATNDSADDE